MSTTRVAVIMAGGSGERFWPLSRGSRPKQLLNLTDPHRSLLAEAVARLLPLVPAQQVFIATGRHLQARIQEAGLGLPPENVLAEPCKRNTSGCLAYAAAAVLQRLGAAAAEVSMAVVTADHQVGAPERFRQALAAAFEAAEAEPVLVTIGVRPTRPETGYGYIEVAAGAEPVHRSSAGVPVLAVTRFHEKPGRDAAEAYVASGRFLWNSGMFFWRVSTFLAELEQANPRLASGATALLAALRAGDTAGAEAVFQGFEDISIDYALMEHARRVLVVPADFPWDDVGAWDALERTLPRDAAGNVAVGDPLLLDSNGCVVYNAPGAERVAVAVIGAQELVVVVAEDAVLVVPKTRAQDVRRIVTALKARGAAQV